MEQNKIKKIKNSKFTLSLKQIKILDIIYT